MITLTWMRIRLLTMYRRWLYILNFSKSLSLLLSNFFLLILGQEFLETRPPLLLASGNFSRPPRSTGWTGFKTDLTGLCRSGTLLFILPPDELVSCSTISLYEICSPLGQFLRQSAFLYLVSNLNLRSTFHLS